MILTSERRSFVPDFMLLRPIVSKELKLAGTHKEKRKNKNALGGILQITKK